MCVCFGLGVGVGVFWPQFWCVTLSLGSCCAPGYKVAVPARAVDCRGGRGQVDRLCPGSVHVLGYLWLKQRRPWGGDECVG